MESKRMTDPVSSLLQLLKLDYHETHAEFQKQQNEMTVYDLSEVISETALPFESIAFEQEIWYEVQVPETTKLAGISEDMKHRKQLWTGFHYREVSDPAKWRGDCSQLSK